jgi:hypothetical protein
MVGFRKLTISGDEKDGNPRQRQRRCQISHPRPGIHACPVHIQHGVRVSGDSYRTSLFLGEAGQRRPENGLSPGGIADDGAFDGGDANVEKAAMVGVMMVIADFVVGDGG